MLFLLFVLSVFYCVLIRLFRLLSSFDGGFCINMQHKCVHCERQKYENKRNIYFSIVRVLCRNLSLFSLVMHSHTRARARSRAHSHTRTRTHTHTCTHSTQTHCDTRTYAWQTHTRIHILLFLFFLLTTSTTTLSVCTFQLSLSSDIVRPHTLTRRDGGWW